MCKKCPQALQGCFTRVNNKNSAEKSVLDYVIVSTNLSENIMSMTIDEGKLFTSWRNLQRARDLLIIMQLYFNYSAKGLEVMTRTIGNWFRILMMITDGKTFVSSQKMTHPYLRYGRVTLMFRSVSKIGK